MTNSERKILDTLRQSLGDYIKLHRNVKDDKELKNVVDYIICMIEDDDNLIYDANTWAEDMEEE